MKGLWLSPKTAILLSLSTLNVVLLVCIVMQFPLDGSVPLNRVAGALNVSGSLKEATARKPFEDYSLILAHPVFFKSRVPFVAPPPAPAALPSTPKPPVVTDPGLVVGGVMLRNGLSKAFLFSKAGPSTGTWASEGEEFQGWRVQSIDNSGVKLEQNGRSIRLTLYPVN
ncbi:MAG: hypothetical protein KGL35_22445 [Bradyrhizobium sp.]|nr:hypothetical protein [Pseudomonadota bacterium]MDE2471410.1 hypothetical protein [Bradyrhizobium sp.]